MKPSILAAALALGVAAAPAVTLAQGSNVVERTITVGSSEPTPESPAAARREAAAALAQAQRDCRKESDRDARKSCLDAARDDYRTLMAEASSSR